MTTRETKSLFWSRALTSQLLAALSLRLVNTNTRIALLTSRAASEVFFTRTGGLLAWQHGAGRQADTQAGRQTDMTRSETKSLFWSDRLFRVHVVLIAQFRLP
jgi:hypothetical protein